ncbi:MAG TPA: hypothetical protein VN833_08090 [Candidatus Acidoferrales bacterium]|nr:hypothetical protein [Candidatus Acidoferrales bacterium]
MNLLAGFVTGTSSGRRVRLLEPYRWTCVVSMPKLQVAKKILLIAYCLSILERGTSRSSTHVWHDDRFGYIRQTTHG